MVRRIYVKKKDGFNVSEEKLKADLKQLLNIDCEIKEFIRYDVENLEEPDFTEALKTIFSEPPVDEVFLEELPALEGYDKFVVEYLPGQYDQRADSASQCVQLLTMKNSPLIECAKIYAVKGCSKEEVYSIKKYLINPVESREGTFNKPESLKKDRVKGKKVEVLKAFIKLNDNEIAEYHKNMGFAMSVDDLIFVRDYFLSEKRPPTVTELKVIDTYWSDHCRHTTFSTELKNITVKSSNPHIQKALDCYTELFADINKGKNKHRCLMDIATIAVKALKKEGYLKNLDESDEINACSIRVDADVDGQKEEWIVMFKNETHNHPTEIEPVGGAATCLGGAIRDPLSGRTYVYQAMRVTGAADPREKIKDTLKGKLPQRVICNKAAAGFSSYGNQIGLATGTVAEMYHPNYKAKRLETGYVIAAAPKGNIVRKKPESGDIVILLGGDTGRDGCGGATGSSKAHTTKSVSECGAEVQKGNPLTERKLQRLFRNKNAANLIIKCNDFGAGGVSVAIGELSDGLDIYLDKVPKKYEGLDGTEIAISESQERMAVVVKEKDVDKFISLAAQENLNATPVATVTDLGRMRMFLDGECIVNIKREFLDTNGVKQITNAEINDDTSVYYNEINENIKSDIAKKDYKNALIKELARLNVCSTKGLGETFDSTIGAGSVFMPFGGKRQLTPCQVMAAKLPVLGKTNTATVSSYACYPYLNENSPFTGAIYSIVASVSKLISSGVKFSTVYLTLQEFFKKLGKDPKRWGEPLSALLGAMYAQFNMKIAAIGGKDSMSGTFENIDVPPTLISFAVGIANADKLISNTFKDEEEVYLIRLPKDEFNIPVFEKLENLYDSITEDISKGKIKAAGVVEEGGLISAIVKSCMGNEKGFSFDNMNIDLFKASFGDIYVAGKPDKTSKYSKKIGKINNSKEISCKEFTLSVGEAIKAFESTLESVYPSKGNFSGDAHTVTYEVPSISYNGKKIAKPRVFIPVFPGTNCEYDTKKAFERAGAICDIFVIKNRTSKEVEASASEIGKMLKNYQIVAFPGGFSGGDEPDGSGKFIATAFRNFGIKKELEELLFVRDGLALGICNGFQALVKLGLLPFGKIESLKEDSATLTFNNISRHVSTITRIRVASTLSPWFKQIKAGEVFNVPVSHGEGRFVANEQILKKLIDCGQIATQYVDFTNNATMVSPFNPNASMMAIEGITNADGRILGKMGHSERYDENLYKNVEGNYDMKIFESGVKYFS